MAPDTAARRMILYRLVMWSSVVVFPLVGTTPLRRLLLSLAYGYIGSRMQRPMRAAAWRDAIRRFHEAQAAQDAHLIPADASRQVGRSDPAARRW